jgi:glycosyltransferase involved in cell wall biosynthesis
MAACHIMSTQDCQTLKFHKLRVLILHNDLRVYWKRRLTFLRGFLKSRDIDLYVIELFGKGSPYAFDPYDNKEVWWNCLFPDNKDNELSKSKIKDVLFAKLADINPDVIVAGSIVFYSGALGLRWAKNNNKKFIMFDDAKPSNVKRNAVVQRVKDAITNQIDALWLPSKNYEEEYASLYSKESIHFFYGYNCIDNDLFKFKQQKRFDNRKIICVARLVPIKNLTNLLMAWKTVEDESDRDTLVILGDGTLSVELVALRDELGLKRVEFVGAIPNDLIPKYLFDSDAFILPSWSESWGLVVNEAMAAGLPVLLSNKVNAAETLLVDGINGYSFSPADVKVMSEKIVQFIQLPTELKEKMSANSLEIINTLSYENMGNELLKTLLLLKSMPVKKKSFIANLLINLWDGRYNTQGWDTISV